MTQQYEELGVVPQDAFSCCSECENTKKCTEEKKCQNEQNKKTDNRD
jgi:hypothetical protein